MKIAFYGLNQNFCQLIKEELEAYHTVKYYRHTNNQVINWANMMKLLDWCDLAYFEFIQSPLPEMSQLEVFDKPIVARMDGIDVLNHSQIDWRRVDALVLMPVQEKRLTRLRNDWNTEHPKKQLLPLPKRILRRNIGIDLDIYQPDYSRQPGYTIGFHAFTIRATKRVYTMLQTFHELVRKDPDKPWKLHFMGAGWQPGTYNWPERQEYMMSLMEHIEDLHPMIGDRLMITPHNDPPEVWSKIAQKTDIMWSTSYREGFPNSIGEAAASGSWPLMNHFYGAETIYPEENLCWTPIDMVEKTIEWGNLSDDEKIQRRHDIRAWMEQYNKKETARDIRLLCEEVLENKRK